MFIGILLMTAGMISSGALALTASPSYLREQDRIAVSVLPTASQDSMKLTEDDIAGIADTLDAPVTWWGTLRAGISTDMRETQADIFAVGGPFIDFHPVKMRYGSFLSRIGGDEGAIVLTSGLAWELFGTEDAIGMEVKLRDETYIVTGVCDADETLIGLLSETGTGRAYIPYNPLDNIPVSGMEAALQKSIPGKSLKAVEDAFGTEGKAVPGFLFQDVTEQALLDAELPGLPVMALVCILAVMLAVMAKRAVSGMARRLKVFLQENYFRDAWGMVLWKTVQMLLIAAAAAALIYTLVLLADFRFFMPARFIPGSLIDLDFYKELIKSETNLAIAALSYLPAPWEILHDAAMQAAGYMNMLSLTGIAVFASGLNMLKDARAAENGCLKGFRSGAWDIPALWIFLAIAMGSGLLICSAAGLPAYLPAGLTAILLFGISLWALRLLYRSGLESIFESTAREKPAMPDLTVTKKNA